MFIFNSFEKGLGPILISDWRLAIGDEIPTDEQIVLDVSRV